MLVLNEIVETNGGIERLREAGLVRLLRNGRTLLLEHLGFGPTAEHSIRLEKVNKFGVAEYEMHLEWRREVWLPFYFKDRATDTELFLFRHSETTGLRVDFWAGARMIETAGLLDLSLWAEGFVEAAEESRYHPLFPVTGGAA